MASSRWALVLRPRAVLKIATLVALLVGANLAAAELADALRFELRPSNEHIVHRMIMTTAVLYMVLIAIPFVPGVEVGLALIAALGPPIALLVYLCTVAGLCLAFAIGRLFGLPGLVRLFDELGLPKTAALLRSMQPLGLDERVALLLRKAPARLVPVLVRHRYLALAVTLNLPGNFVLGGGGGIAMIAGVSRLYSIPGFLGTVALAVAPVPLGILLFGDAVLGN